MVLLAPLIPPAQGEPSKQSIYPDTWIRFDKGALRSVNTDNFDEAVLPSGVPDVVIIELEGFKDTDAAIGVGRMRTFFGGRSFEGEDWRSKNIFKLREGREIKYGGQGGLSAGGIRWIPGGRVLRDGSTLNIVYDGYVWPEPDSTWRPPCEPLGDVLQRKTADGKVIWRKVVAVRNRNAQIPHCDGISTRNKLWSRLPSLGLALNDGTLIIGAGGGHVRIWPETGEMGQPHPDVRILDAEQVIAFKRQLKERLYKTLDRRSPKFVDEFEEQFNQEVERFVFGHLVGEKE